MVNAARKVSIFLDQESILSNFFLRKTIFFHFLLLRLSVCSIRKHCLYFKITKLNGKESEKTKKSKFGRIGMRIKIDHKAEKYQNLSSVKLIFHANVNKGHFQTCKSPLKQIQIDP